MTMQGVQSNFRRHKGVFIVGGLVAVGWVWYSYRQAGGTVGGGTTTATDTTGTTTADTTGTTTVDTTGVIDPNTGIPYSEEYAMQGFGQTSFPYDPSLEYGYAAPYNQPYGGGWTYDSGLSMGGVGAAGGAGAPIHVQSDVARRFKPKRRTHVVVRGHRPMVPVKKGSAHAVNGFYRVVPPGTVIQVENGVRYTVSAATFRAYNATKPTRDKIRPVPIIPSNPILSLPFGGRV